MSHYVAICSRYFPAISGYSQRLPEITCDTLATLRAKKLDRARRTSGLGAAPQPGPVSESRLSVAWLYLSCLGFRIKNRAAETVHRLVARRTVVRPQETAGDRFRTLVCSQLA